MSDYTNLWGRRNEKKFSSILLEVYLAIKCATRGNQVYFSNEVGHCCGISHRTKTLSPHLVTPTVSIIGLLLFLTAKHAGASKVVVQAPSPSNPEHISRCHLWSPTKSLKSMARLTTSQPCVLAKLRLWLLYARLKKAVELWVLEHFYLVTSHIESLRLRKTSEITDAPTPPY